MKTVVYEPVDEMLAWAKAHMGGNNFRDDGVPIGIMSEGELIGVTVFDSHTTTGCWVSVASDGGKRWITREYILRCFAYPFIQCGYPRISAFVSVDNHDAVRFNESFGWKREGIMRKAGEHGEDLIMFGMLRSECRWLPETFSGNIGVPRL